MDRLRPGAGDVKDNRICTRSIVGVDDRLPKGAQPGVVRVQNREVITLGYKDIFAAGAALPWQGAGGGTCHVDIAGGIRGDSARVVVGGGAELVGPNISAARIELAHEGIRPAAAALPQRQGAGGVSTHIDFAGAV